MTYISALSFKIENPDVMVVLITTPEDKEQIETISMRNGLVFDEIVTPEVPTEIVSEGPVMISRFLRTNIGRFFSPPLIFLDSDTVTFREVPRLEEVEQGFDVALCHDRNEEFKSPYFPNWIRPHYDALGWRPHRLGYFNAGIFSLADTESAKRFLELWYENFQAFYRQSGKILDQPAFNASMFQAEIAPDILPVSYNAIVESSPYFAKSARIVHYFMKGAPRRLPEDSILHQLVELLSLNGEFDPEKLRKDLARGNPWHTTVGSVHRSLAVGNYKMALSCLFERILGS
ncbi:MAG: putative nucleotide-diphospho-sugar transferase [Verrucomicrobiota bacterium]